MIVIKGHVSMFFGDEPLKYIPATRRNLMRIDFIVAKKIVTFLECMVVQFYIPR